MPSEEERYAQNMHDWELLKLPEEPLPPARTDPRLRWPHLGVLAACAFVWGLLLYHYDKGVFS